VAITLSTITPVVYGRELGMRIRGLAVAGVSAVVALAMPGAAQAAAPVPFTLTDSVDQTPVRHFTTTGGVLCPSGTFTDDVLVQAFPHSEKSRSGGGNVLIRSHYTCDDDSGTFDALKHIRLTFTETGFTGVGPMQILGGSGAYAGVVGHGAGEGATDLETGLGGGTTSGFVRVP
jgi:hypothetical protein